MLMCEPPSHVRASLTCASLPHMCEPPSHQFRPIKDGAEQLEHLLLSAVPAMIVAIIQLNSKYIYLLSKV